MRWIGEFFGDVRYGLRALAKSPGFTLVAVLSLALGIGANTAIFSIMNGILLRSMAVPNPQELRLVEWSGTNVLTSQFTGSIRTEGGRQVSETVPYPTWRDFRESASGVADVFAFFPLFNLTTQTRGEVGVSDGMMVSGNYFSGLGARALIGRTLETDDDRPGADPAAVITYRCWQRRFGLDPRALGQTLSVNRNPFTIVGILGPDYASPMTGDPADFYVSLAAQPQLQPERSLSSYNDWWVLTMARLAPGASDAQLDALLTAALERTLKQSRTRIEAASINVSDGRRGIVPGRQRLVPALLALQGIVAVVLLIACFNLAGLLLARAAARRREFAVRAAIGAGRWRLMRQSLAESLLLAAAGAGAGLLFGSWIKDALLRFKPNVGFEMHLDTRTDARVLIFALALTLAAALLCGLMPALRGSRVDPATDMRSGRSAGGGRQRLGRMLVAAQVAMSALLLAGAGLFIRSLDNLRAADPGFNPDKLLLFRLSADQAGYSAEKRIAFFDQVREELERIPGVGAAAASDKRLLGGSMSNYGFSIPGGPARPQEAMQTSTLVVSDGFFRAMRIPLEQGRDFGPGDAKGSEPAMIVNDLFVKRFFPEGSPLGRSVRIGRTDYRIVGVCGATLYDDVRKDKPPTAYLAARQAAPASMNFAVRSALPPMSIIPAARKTVAAIDPTIPLADISTQAEQFERSLFFERLFSNLCGSLAALAVLLCCVGIYGLLAFGVARRTSEIGVRMALGARPGDVARAIVRDALAMTAWGLAVGLPAAIGLGFIARKAFYGVAPYDPLTMGLAVGGLLAAAALAAWLPARRAARVDPMTALRAE